MVFFPSKTQNNKTKIHTQGRTVVITCFHLPVELKRNGSNWSAQWNDSLIARSDQSIAGEVSMRLLFLLSFTFFFKHRILFSLLRGIKTIKGGRGRLGGMCGKKIRREKGRLESIQNKYECRRMTRMMLRRVWFRCGRGGWARSLSVAR